MIHVGPGVNRFKASSLSLSESIELARFDRAVHSSSRERPHLGTGPQQEQFL